MWEYVLQYIGYLNTMIGILIPFLLLIPTPVKACSPRLDGEPTYCPPWDGVLEKHVKEEVVSIQEEDIPDYYSNRVTLYDTRMAHMGHSFPTDQWIEKIRDHESRRKRTPIEEMLNNTLAEYENGSDGSTESEELLQLPSNRD